MSGTTSRGLKVLDSSRLSPVIFSSRSVSSDSFAWQIGSIERTLTRSVITVVGVDNRGGEGCLSEEPITIGVDSSESGEGGIDSKAEREREKERMTFAVAIKGIVAVAARETTLNSLITGVTFGKIAL